MVVLTDISTLFTVKQLLLSTSVNPLQSGSSRHWNAHSSTSDAYSLLMVLFPVSYMNRLPYGGDERCVELCTSAMCAHCSAFGGESQPVCASSYAAHELPPDPVAHLIM